MGHSKTSSTDPGVAAAKKARQFIEGLTHTKGRWAGSPFHLLPWQWDGIIKPLFGTLKADGKRQYRTCYCEIPKKNGKTELAAAIALKMLFADGEMGGEIYSAAADRQQAALAFNVASQMVRKHPILSKRCKIIDSQKRIVVPKTASVYIALSSEVATKHGFNASGIIFDELHAQPNRELWDVLTLGSGDAREQQIVFAITTAGYDRHSICYEQRSYAEKVRDGIIEDPTFLPVIYGLKDGASWEDESEWALANPSLGEILDIDKIRDAYKKAKETPALENSFRRLRLNEWTTSDVKYIDMREWDACEEKFTYDELRGMECYAHLDLSSTTDLTALSLVFRLSDGTYRTLAYFWVPQENIADRARRDRVPYDLWSRAGLIEATPGNVIDYQAIIRRFDQVAKDFDIVEIGFDPWNAKMLMQEIERAGFSRDKMVEIRQGVVTFNEPTHLLHTLVKEGKIKHDGNPVLRWNISNTMLEISEPELWKPSKKKSTERIDGCVALICALSRAMVHTDTTSVYESRGVLTFGTGG
jgi:phage terminase large subunit-like protein